MLLSITAETMPFNVSCILIEMCMVICLLILFLLSEEEQSSKTYHRMVFKTKREHQWPGGARQTANQELESQHDYRKRIIKLYMNKKGSHINNLKYLF